MKLPALNSFIEISDLIDDRYMVFNKYTKKTFSLGENEYKVLIRLDGVINLEEIEKHTAYSKKQIESLITVFEGIGFLETSDIKRKLNILKLSVRVFNPNKLLKSTALVKALSSILLFGMLPILILSIIFNIVQGASLSNILNDVAITTQSPSFLVSLPIIFIVTFLHEMGHAVIAKRFGVNVSELGVMLYWFMPAAYVNMTGVNFLKKKSQRLLVYCGGILTNLFILALVLIARPFIFADYQFIVSWFVVSTLMSIMFNFLIFLKLDGYLIFKELVDIPELREKSFKYLLNMIKKSINIRQLNSLSQFQMQVDNEYTGMQKSIFTCYGLLSILFIPVLLISIGFSVFINILA